MPGEYQFTPFEVGQIKAHLHHDLGPAAIARILVKPDGESHWSLTAVKGVVDKLTEDPHWRGERQKGSGRERETTKKQDQMIVAEVFRNRGRVIVTVAHLRKKFAWLKDFGNTLIEERLHEAGLQWLRRRRKSLVASKYVPERIAYCEAVKRKHNSTLLLWCYSDGTVFYLDRTDADNEDTQRAALGTHIWRHSDGRDALFADCVGPSSYRKAQGLPVRVWGLLAEGVLHISILDEGECMNAQLYAELIEDRFEEWMGSSRYLVQDFEGCLRSEEALHALQSIGLELVSEYPRVSQDFNAIENAWKLLRERLDQTLPTGKETRDAFIQRLKSAVAWVNRNRRNELAYLSTNQKERANDCLLLHGARTKW